MKILQGLVTAVAMADAEERVKRSTIMYRPIDGGYSEWGEWSSCDESKMVRTRLRKCNNPAPEHGGAPCGKLGPRFEETSCDVDGGLGDWQKSSDCVDGNETWVRLCNNPAPEYNGKDCDPPSMSEQRECKVDGGISQWTAYGPCENGERKRTRSCTDPAPAYGGAECEEFKSEQTIPCKGASCPVNKGALYLGCEILTTTDSYFIGRGHKLTNKLGKDKGDFEKYGNELPGGTYCKKIQCAQFVYKSGGHSNAKSKTTRSKVQCIDGKWQQTKKQYGELVSNGNMKGLGCALGCTQPPYPNSVLHTFTPNKNGMKEINGIQYYLPLKTAKRKCNCLTKKTPEHDFWTGDKSRCAANGRAKCYCYTSGGCKWMKRHPHEEASPMNCGTLSEWSDWSSCSDGTRSATRTCSGLTKVDGVDTEASVDAVDCGLKSESELEKSESC